jgi:hypothetical protein
VACANAGSMDSVRPDHAFGLTGLLGEPLERVLVRSRGLDLTGSGWRLTVTCDQGTGGIVLVDVSGDESWFRGDGVFLGWPQVRLAETYRALTAPLDGLQSDLDLPQLG